MSRKMAAVLPPPASEQDKLEQPSIMPPESAGPAPARKRGRPPGSKTRAAEPTAPPVAMDPKDTLQITFLVLRGIGTVARADAPTDDEVEAVNGPLCLVLNKYNFAGRMGAEMTLAATLLVVVAQMKIRRGEKTKLAAAEALASVAPNRHAFGVRVPGAGDNETGSPDRSGAQGVREVATDAAIPEVAAALARD